MACGAQLLGRRWRWLRPLVRRLRDALGTGSRPRMALVVEFIRNDAGFRRACELHDLTVNWQRRSPPRMDPASGAPGSWPVPAITSLSMLAARLDLSEAELGTLIDLLTRIRNSE